MQNDRQNLAEFLTLSLVLALTLSAQVCQAEPKRFEFSPMVGYIAGGTFEDELTGTEIKLSDSDTVGFQFNIRADARSFWEIQYARQETHVPNVGGISVVVEKFEVGGVYETSTGINRPYAAATVGLSRFEPQSEAFQDDTYFSFTLGGGVRFLTDRRFGIIFDARWVAAVIDEDTDFLCRSDGGLSCLIQTKSGLASQFRVHLGVSARF